MPTAETLSRAAQSSQRLASSAVRGASARGGGSRGCVQSREHGFGCAEIGGDADVIGVGKALGFLAGLGTGQVNGLTHQKQCRGAVAGCADERDLDPRKAAGAALLFQMLLHAMLDAAAESAATEEKRVGQQDVALRVGRS